MHLSHCHNQIVVISCVICTFLTVKTRLLSHHLSYLPPTLSQTDCCHTTCHICLSHCHNQAAVTLSVTCTSHTVTTRLLSQLPSHILLTLSQPSPCHMAVIPPSSSPDSSRSECLQPIMSQPINNSTWIYCGPAVIRPAPWWWR